MNLTIELDNPIGFAYVRDEQLKMVCFITDDDDDLELVKEFVEDAKGFEAIEDMGSKWKIDRFVLIKKPDVEYLILEGGLSKGNVVDISHVSRLMEGDSLNEFIINTIKNTPKGWKVILPSCVIRVEETLNLSNK